MTIGIDAHDLEGKRTGVGRYLFNILRVWGKDDTTQRHHIILFFKHSIPEDIPEGFESHVLRAPAGISSNALFMHALLPFAARRRQIDVLFCPGYVAPLGWNKPLVLTLHDLVYEAHPESFNWRGLQDKVLLKFVSKNAAKRANRILTPSQFSAKEILRLYRISEKKIVVTPLATEPLFRPQKDKTQAKLVATRYGVNGPYVFFVGSIFTRRRIPECIAAFTKIAPDFPQHQFLIAGANLTRPHIALETFIANANVHSRRRAIVWTPYIDQTDLPSLYAAADATVWISEYEGFGLPLLESLACGTPVITSQRASIPETVGECAIFVSDSADPNSIADAIRTLLTNPSLRERFANEGPAWAARFSWERCAEQTFATIAETIS